MNYRHAYHAGNPGDVLKHSVLVLILEDLLGKPAPFFVLDTHAGIGVYDLAGTEAGKTGEWEAGIGRLLAAPPVAAMETYLSIVRGLNPDGAARFYPGSPAIVAAMLRPNDRVVLSELHPDDKDMLGRWAHGRTNAAVHWRDGYEAIAAFLPPREKRGLVVVDPPYETPDEFERLAVAIAAGHKKWPPGRWMIWHPIKERAPVWKLEEALIAAGISNMLSIELLIRPVDGVHLAGSGLILINPPYRIEGRLTPLLADLQGALAPDHGDHAIRWLAKA